MAVDHYLGNPLLKKANTTQGFFYQIYEFMFQKTPEGSSDACLDLSGLAPKYIASIPVDPLDGSVEKTFYAIKRDENNRFQMYACHAELEQDISAVR